MGRTPCCEKKGLKKGTWTPEEDQILISYIRQFGHSNWRTLPKLAGLLRCGKSCRLRWTNYLRPDIKRGDFTAEEEETILSMHESLGNRWSAIAAKLPGRTDNDVKNYWRTHLNKRLLKNPIKTSTNIINNHQDDSGIDCPSKSSNDAKIEPVVGKDSGCLDDDLWADVLSDSSFSMADESGFEVQSMVAPQISDDVTDITHSWWLKDDHNVI